MIYVLVTEQGTHVITSEQAKKLGWVGVQDRHDWNTMKEAEDIALLLNLHNTTQYMAIDSGEGVWPRFDVIECPKVGDNVSYAFNGDYTPCGQIKSISKSMKLITTTTGKKFYRQKLSGRWVNNGTWSLVQGHINERNPSF